MGAGTYSCNKSLMNSHGVINTVQVGEGPVIFPLSQVGHQLVLSTAGSSLTIPHFAEGH